MLLERIGGIFDQNLSNSLARFLVPDGGTNRGGLEVVLLVESPHIHEVCYHYPLAGDAGIYVRDVLGKKAGRLFPNEPIGRSVYDGYLDFLRLGIMNVSQLPFQSDAYDCLPVQGANDCRNSDHWDDYKRHMNTIKEGPDPNSRDCTNCKSLDDAIAEDLRGRLECLRGNNPDVLLVSCGEVAQAFYGKAINREPAITMPNICNPPYPSIHRWDSLTGCQEECLRDIINRLWPNPA